MRRFEQWDGVRWPTETVECETAHLSCLFVMRVLFQSICKCGVRLSEAILIVKGHSSHPVDARGHGMLRCQYVELLQRLRCLSTVDHLA